MSHTLDTISSGTTLLLFFIVSLNHRRVNRLANRWFSAFLALLFLVQIQNIFIVSNIAREDDLWFQLIAISDFLIAPIFYISITYYINPFKPRSVKILLHFLFAFVILSLIVISFFTEKGPQPEQIDPQIVERADTIFNAIFAMQVIAYCLLSILKIRKHKRTIEQLYSEVNHINLNWLRNISVMILFIALLWISDIVFQLSDHAKVFDIASSTIYILSVLYISHYWLIQCEIFTTHGTDNTQIRTEIMRLSEPNETRKKLLTEEQLNSYKLELSSLMNRDEPFTDADLNLLKLASSLKISPHNLSFVINEGFNENFFQFINRYRIEKAKKLITDPKMNHLSLLGIGFEVGFNSKTAFNTTFKKITGVTPSDYKKSTSK